MKFNELFDKLKGKSKHSLEKLNELKQKRSKLEIKVQEAHEKYRETVDKYKLGENGFRKECQSFKETDKLKLKEQKERQRSMECNVEIR